MSLKPKQRVVFIDGEHSYLLKGDPNPEAIDAGKALPQLLTKGWRIVSTGGIFVVLEKQPDSD